MSDLGSAKTSSSVSEPSSWNPLCCCGAPWLDMVMDDSCAEYKCCEQTAPCSFMDGVVQLKYVFVDGDELCNFEYTYPEPIICGPYVGWYKVKVTYNCYEGQMYAAPNAIFYFSGTYNGISINQVIALYQTPISDLGCDKEIIVSGFNPWPQYNQFLNGCKFPDTITIGFN